MEFRDLKKQYQVLKPEIDAAMQDVLMTSHYISGPQVKELEQQLAEYVGVKHCITCANGTDAITLAMKAWKIGPGDAVFVPDFTFFSSGECPAAEGATCIFVDVDKDTYNIDPNKLEEAIIAVKTTGKYTPKVVVTVDLFGQPADYDRIVPICKKHNLLLMEDAAQGFGGSIRGQMTGSFGDIATTSFFPAKPLGCYGDGGAIFTNNDEWAALMRSLAVHGKSTTDKYDNLRIGMNSRLDTLQAAILQVKLKAFRDSELDAVNQVAVWYDSALKDVCIKRPRVLEGFTSSWAQYTIQLPQKVSRTEIIAKLKECGIPTMVYYAKPMHEQKAFSETDSAEADCAVTSMLCSCVLSLPIHPYMTEKSVKEIVIHLKQIVN